MSQNRKMTVGTGICKRGAQIRFRRNDVLEALDDVLARENPTVLILNRGAHYREDEELMFDMTNKTIPMLEEYQNRTNARIFWRTSVPGHPQCWNFTSPSNSSEQMEELIANTSLYDPAFKWFDFKRQNALITEALDRSSLKLQYLDGYDLMVLRPDLHRGRITGDCIHSCLPGKTDIYIQLLMHLMHLDVE